MKINSEETIVFEEYNRESIPLFHNKDRIGGVELIRDGVISNAICSLYNGSTLIIPGAYWGFQTNGRVVYNYGGMILGMDGPPPVSTTIRCFDIDSGLEQLNNRYPNATRLRKKEDTVYLSYIEPKSKAVKLTAISNCETVFDVTVIDSLPNFSGHNYSKVDVEEDKIYLYVNYSDNWNPFQGKINPPENRLDYRDILFIYSTSGEFIEKIDFNPIQNWYTEMNALNEKLLFIYNLDTRIVNIETNEVIYQSYDQEFVMNIGNYVVLKNKQTEKTFLLHYDKNTNKVKTIDFELNKSKHGIYLVVDS